MDSNVKNLMIGYVTEIHGKFLDQNIKYPLTFKGVLLNKMENHRNHLSSDR